jgi:hypothetical protein
MKSIVGMKVVMVPSKPRMTLSGKVPVTPEFRAEINVWMAEFFGYESVIEDDKIIVDKANNTIFVNERTYHQLRKVEDTNHA